ncbi:uncharacterized protein LOC141902099 [Tubulanus polymorphus]|uniref:uncharacterized protein LOC141902099 n=1 Tax=Tubulanus polymorphus TaxID=672921 RepID=UPI003DA24986
MHEGVNATIAFVRQKYWVPQIRRRITSLIHKCVPCIKAGTGKPFVLPDPAPLPAVRVQEAPPFSVVGIDYTGALIVRTESSDAKVYICLITCAITRALHLELVTDLTCDAFLLAFRRFCARRSFPRIVYSDNASTVTCAFEELSNLFKSLKIFQFMAQNGVEWRFIPKRAPWFRGLWERLVGMVKSCLKRVLGRAKLNYDELNTVVIECECIINDRPLTYVDSRVLELEPLTPSHLIYGRRISALPQPITDADTLADPDYGHSELNRRQEHRAVLVQHFWGRWKNEYLTALRERHNQSGNNQEIVKIGDIVQIHADNPRLTWRLGIIEKLNRGNDNCVRSAVVRTAKGRTSRPINKLYPLEINHQEFAKQEPQPEKASKKKGSSARNVLLPLQPCRNFAPGECRDSVLWSDSTLSTLLLFRM